MKFEWDGEKNRKNIAKHGFDFRRAAKIFNGLVLTFPDKRKNYGEERFNSIGLAGKINIVVVTHTSRNNVIRIISARRASKRERNKYEIYKTVNR